MAKIKRLILCMIPNQACNLRCEYCYISQVEAWDIPQPLIYSAEYISKCLSVKRLGGISLINLTGNGETMLQPDIVDIIGALLKEGHFVEVVTNGTISGPIHAVLKFSGEWLSRLHFKISFHYKELVRLNIIEGFFDNINAIHDAGASFTLELLAYDAIEDEIDNIKQICMERVGAVCHGTIGRDDKRKDKALLSRHNENDFRRIWGTLNSQMLDFKLNTIGKKRKEFCYAGLWSLFVNLYTGESQPCYWQPYNQNIFKSLDKAIVFRPVGFTCTQPYCTNAHAHMTWGIIPELNTPTYCDMRNRVCANGEEWLTNECKEFFSSKLSESNAVYSPLYILVYSITFPFRLFKWFLRDYKNNIRRIKNYLNRTG